MMLKLQKIIWIGLLIGSLALGVQAQAQTAEPTTNAPQFLYRNGDKLILVNAETGDAETLPGITAGEKDRFEWSAGGQYLAVKTRTSTDQDYPYCLNVYSVVERRMLYNEPLSCIVLAQGFSHDGTRIAFATRTDDHFNSVLWLQSLTDATATLVYETTGGNPPIGEENITEIQWAPADHYISYIMYHVINGGSLNSLHILNVNSLSEYSVSGGSFGFYAYYTPIWSPDDQWFLLDLAEEYAHSVMMPYTNQAGDLYLVSSETGEMHRLTYTPAEPELSIRWTENGEIAFTTIKETTLSVTDALAIQAPPPETIIEPAPVSEEDTDCMNVYYSQNPTLVARMCKGRFLEPSDNDYVDFKITSNDKAIYRADDLPQADYTTVQNNIMIGWRPQRPK